ncbi:MAG: hypothetical protein ACPGPE_04350, partial [Planctomycetota bacterium]
MGEPVELRLELGQLRVEVFDLVADILHGLACALEEAGDSAVHGPGDHEAVEAGAREAQRVQPLQHERDALDPPERVQLVLEVVEVVLDPVDQVRARSI